jgi:glycosyltransferase involved in cell wall biosynthesis
MRDIQIICVNDGSPDNSRAILQEYADRDSRIEIIDQANQGGGSARNAAYPFIRGQYSYFVDPDDWIDLDLCRQCYDRAEATEADFVVLRYIKYKPRPKCCHPFNSALPEIRRSPEEKLEILTLTATWQRFWRYNFLLSHGIKFSEGKRMNNDVLPSWKGTVHARACLHYSFR